MINTSKTGENLCGLERADFQKVIDGKQTDLFILCPAYTLLCFSSNLF